MIKKRWTDEEIAFVMNNYTKMTCKEMATYLKVRTKDAIQMLLNKFKVKRPQLKIGDKFGRLTIISEKFYARCGNQQMGRIRVRCECGTEKEVWIASLKSRNTVSCGCWKTEKDREKMLQLNLSHGLSNHPLYRQYHGMISRCKYPNRKYYKDYGGRGICVCQEWLDSFETFYEWAIENGYEEGLTIERVDNNKGYSPENCKWATLKEQANNKRSNHLLTAFDETKTVTQWSEDSRCCVPYCTLNSRIKLGWNNEKAISTPVDPKRSHKKK